MFSYTLLCCLHNILLIFSLHLKGLGKEINNFRLHLYTTHGDSWDLYTVYLRKYVDRLAREDVRTLGCIAYCIGQPTVNRGQILRKVVFILC